MGVVKRRVQVVLLCEDTQHEAFVRRFLSATGWQTRTIRVEKAPAGRGSAERYVRRQFPKELKAHRLRPVNQALVVILDGDRVGVEERVRQLNEACETAGVNVRTPDERIAVLVPTWNIETWLSYLSGETVDETKPDYPKLTRERECQRHVDTLVEMCNAGELRRLFPASLESACGEYRARLK